MYNIFISYRRDGGYEMARLLYEHLKNMGLKPFLDIEELRSGPFNVRLYKTIDECPNFLPVLSPGALDRCKNEGDWLRLEIAHAVKGKKNIIPVLMPRFDWTELPEDISSLPDYNGVHMIQDYFDASVEKIVSMLKDVNPSAGSNSGAEFSREQNTYFTAADEKEKKRLETQQELLKQFDEETYRKVVGRYESLRVLDLGCNDGKFVMDRIGASGKMEKLIGIEYDGETVRQASAQFGRPGDYEFIEADLEDEDCFVKLKKKMSECGISSFNVVNVSMVILHLKNPYRLLKNIRGFLEKGASIIIKDIDDGFDVAYPDSGGDFDRVIRICARNETSGYRQSGRQILPLLRRAGFRNIALEKLCMTTVGMDYEERSALFDVYFSFILEDLKIMVDRYPDDKMLQRDLDWYRDVYDDLEERFHSDDFFFSLGFMLFTAQK